MAAAIRQAIVDDIFASREVFFLADAHVSQAGGLTETGALADDGSSVSVIAARKARTLAGFMQEAKEVLKLPEGVGSDWASLADALKVKFAMQTLKAKPGQRTKHVLSVVDADHFLADDASELRNFLDTMNSASEALCEASSSTEIKVVFTNCKWHGILGEALVELPLGKAKRLSATSVGNAAVVTHASSAGDAHSQDSETCNVPGNIINPPVKAILFDADGTLLDSLPPHVDFCHAMNEKYCSGNLNIPPRTEGRRVHASPMDNFLRRAGFEESLIPTLVEEYEAKFGAEHPVIPFPLAHTMIQALRAAAPDGTKIGIVSSNVRANITKAFQLAEVPDVGSDLDVFCGLDNAPSRDKGETLAAVLKQLGIRGSEAIYVGDTVKDYRHSYGVNGMEFIGVAYGFDDLVAARDKDGDLISSAKVATNPQELMDILVARVRAK
eukprot:INCI10144.1.p1 GENE.INCI10144.1~~INCI10144.1.p1  ORF type:complete len:441 (+),score=91.75 INCI10144.1:174-1496(+)